MASGRRLAASISALLGFVISVASSPDAFGQSKLRGLASVWRGQVGQAALEGYFLIQVAPGVVLREGRDERGGVATGVGEIDALDRSCSVVEVGRLLPDPPRGHRDPESFRRLGLDRIYYLILAEPSRDVGRIARTYGALRSVTRGWTDAPVVATQIPNDTNWSSQWNMTAGNLDCPAGWDVATDSTVVISVIDTGGDLSHPDLVGNLWINAGEIPGNGIDDDGNGFIDDVNGWDFWNGDDSPDDDHGHGTHVSGIVGAKGNNSLDVAGVCWSAPIQEVKVLGSNGIGSWAAVAQGFTYAADNGASVLNASLGGVIGDPALSAAVDYANSVDVVQVAAAGNNGNSTPFYPAAYDHVIAVMATDANQQLPSWSDYGSWCDLCAPGDGILSLWPGGLTNWYSGTSMASPHVAGIAALVRTVNPQLDALDTELVIRYSATDLGTPGQDATYQWGLADLGQALLKAGNLTLSTQDAGFGSVVSIQIERADRPGDFYMILPSLSGSDPGFLLAPYFPADARTVPVNVDILTLVELFNSYPQYFFDFSGTLDASGRATALIAVPPGHLFAPGQTVTFCAITFSPTDFSSVKTITNTVELHLK
jgi:subtilisin family serine protease